MVLYVLMLCAFAVTTAELVVVGVLPEISDAMDVSESTAGLLVTAYAVAVAVGGPVLTLLTRKTPRREVLVRTMVVAVLAAAVSAVAPSLWILVVGRVLGGLAQALFLAVAVEVASASVAPDKQPSAVAKVVTGFTLAVVMGVPIGALIGQALGWRYTFAFIALLCALGLIGTVLRCPKIEHRPEGGVLGTVRTVVRPPLMLGMLTLFLMVTGVIGAYTYVVEALEELSGFTDGATSLLLVVYGVGTFVGTTLAGRVSTHRLKVAMPLVVLGTAVVLVTHGLMLENKASAAVSMFLLGAVAFGIEPILVSWVMIQAGPGSMLAAAVNNSVFALAAGTGPLIGGLVIDSDLGHEMLGPIGAIPALLGVFTAIAGVTLTRRYPPVSKEETAEAPDQRVAAEPA